ncbi:MAG: M23 family peptidase [Erythrobacter sp.]|nr:M23 family peptidase [Erythrobacter sp.]
MRRGWLELLAGSQNLRLFIKTASAALLGCLALLSGPVLANSSANANADITQPLRQTQGGALTGDEKFQQLFASWEALDRSGPQGSTLRPSVSIPSRLPLDGPALTSGFGMRTHPVLGGRRQHKGIDLAAPTGTPIYATADGIVGKAQWYSTYGLYVEIAHGAQLETRYAHMSRLAVAPGERVRKGDVIGYVGSTGRSTGPHLHYEVRIGDLAVDPLPYMTGAAEAIRLAGKAEQLAQGGD